MAGYNSLNLLSGYVYNTDCALVNVSFDVDNGSPSLLLSSDTLNISGTILDSSLAEVMFAWQNDGNYVSIYNETTQIDGNIYEMNEIRKYRALSIGGTSDDAYLSTMRYLDIIYSQTLGAISIPSKEPSDIPSSMPTSIPTNVPTGQDTGATDLNVTIDNNEEVTASNENDSLGQEFINVIVTVVLILSFVTPFILFIAARKYHNEFEGSDRPNYASLFKVAWNVGDFYSDVKCFIWLYFVFVCLLSI